jgi:hypothetical protein
MIISARRRPTKARTPDDASTKGSGRYDRWIWRVLSSVSLTLVILTERLLEGADHRVVTQKVHD